jgi:pyridoxine kinase
MIQADMAILSVQSQLVDGALGNSAAGFILARLGHEVWPLPSILLSHNPALGNAGGGPIDARLLMSVIEGLAERGRFAECSLVMSGYLGEAACVDIVLDALARAKAAHPDRWFLCDPVMGDHGHAYVSKTLIEAFRSRLVPQADIVTPNPFELSVLTGGVARDRREAFAALESLGRRCAIVTGFSGADTPGGALDILMVAEGQRFRVGVVRHEAAISGAGDAFAAFFAASLLDHRNRLEFGAAAAMALGFAAAASDALIGATIAYGRGQLAIVESQAVWGAELKFVAAQQCRLK